MNGVGNVYVDLWATFVGLLIPDSRNTCHVTQKHDIKWQWAQFTKINMENCNRKSERLVKRKTLMCKSWRVLRKKNNYCNETMISYEWKRYKPINSHSPFRMKSDASPSDVPSKIRSRKRPSYVQEPNFRSHFCSSKGNQAMSIWQVLLNIPGGIHLTLPWWFTMMLEW